MPCGHSSTWLVRALASPPFTALPPLKMHSNFAPEIFATEVSALAQVPSKQPEVATVDLVPAKPAAPTGTRHSRSPNRLQVKRVWVTAQKSLRAARQTLGSDRQPIAKRSVGRPRVKKISLSTRGRSSSGPFAPVFHPVFVTTSSIDTSRSAPVAVNPLHYPSYRRYVPETPQPPTFADRLARLGFTHMSAIDLCPENPQP